jgi:capsular exopolysaccharide synthesis family protein
VIAVLTALGIAAAGLYLARATPLYTAQTTVFFSFGRGGTASELNQGTTFAQGLVKSFAEVVTTEQVLVPVIERLELDATPKELARRVEAVQSENTLLLTLEVTDRNPDTAASTADAVAEQLSRSVGELVPSAGGAASTINVTRLSLADVPTTPSSPRGLPVVLGVGTLLGLLAGIGLATLMELFDDRIRTADTLRLITGGPVLGELTPRGALFLHDGRPAAVEPVRRLRMNLTSVLERQQLKTVLVTSAARGDGRTSTAIALAEAFAEAGSRVVIVDADLRHPSVAHRLPVAAGPGLREILGGFVPWSQALQQGHVGGLSVITAGAAATDPGPLLAKQDMSRLLEELSTDFDVVLVDGPDLSTSADAAALGKHVEGTVLVVRHGRSRVPRVRQACDTLALADVEVLGTVLNRIGHLRLGPHRRQNTTPQPAARPAAVAEPHGDWLLEGRDGTQATSPLSTRQ